MAGKKEDCLATEYTERRKKILPQRHKEHKKEKERRFSHDVFAEASPSHSDNTDSRDDTDLLQRSSFLVAHD